MYSILKSYGIDKTEVFVPSNCSSGCSRSVADVAKSCNMVVEFGSESYLDADMIVRNYYLHEDKLLMGASGIRHERQIFRGGVTEFRLVLCKYTAEVGFHFRYIKNDKCSVTAVCNFYESKSCMWRVHASVLLINGLFCIKKLDHVHTCGTAV